MIMNEDRTYKISCYASTRISAEASIKDMPVRTWFRNKAYFLAHDPSPTFDVCGLGLRRTFLVGINERVLGYVAALAEGLAVPEACVGELIACYNMPETADAAKDGHAAPFEEVK